MAGTKPTADENAGLSLTEMHEGSLALVFPSAPRDLICDAIVAFQNDYSRVWGFLEYEGHEPTSSKRKGARQTLSERRGRSATPQLPVRPILDTSAAHQIHLDAKIHLDAQTLVSLRRPTYYGEKVFEVGSAYPHDYSDTKVMEITGLDVRYKKEEIMIAFALRAECHLFFFWPKNYGRTIRGVCQDWCHVGILDTEDFKNAYRRLVGFTFIDARKVIGIVNPDALDLSFSHQVDEIDFSASRVVAYGVTSPESGALDSVEEEQEAAADEDMDMDG
ncbi:hypothetical protein F5Y18DRAFT_424274 [Xylariaceae sp. FL1019]|nr:hypothetical protein F5Y18DRAFT_424274 [Xylariaceae sp. FL1019]